MQRYPGIHSEADLAALETYDPMQALEARQYLAGANYLIQQTTQAAHGRVAEERQKLDAIEGKKWLEKHPEFQRDPQAFNKLNEASVPAMKAIGWSEERLAAAMAHGLSAEEREAVTIITRAYMAQQGIKNHQRKPPPVIRPGQGGSSGPSDSMRALDKQLNETGNVKVAGRLLAKRWSNK